MSNAVAKQPGPGWKALPGYAYFVREDYDPSGIMNRLVPLAAKLDSARCMLISRGEYCWYGNWTSRMHWQVRTNLRSHTMGVCVHADGKQG